MQLKCGGERFNILNAQIICNNNEKRMKKFAWYFVELYGVLKNVQLLGPPWDK